MPPQNTTKLLKEILELLNSPHSGLVEIKSQITEILDIVREIRDIVRPVVPVPERVNIVVKPGDTLGFYARVFSITVEEIVAVNPGIVDPDVIFPGQIVIIPAPPPVGPSPGITSAQHLVRSGDTLFAIARQYGVSLAQLIAVNPQIVDPDVISVNQVINLPVTPPAPPAPPPGTIQIFVTVGETLRSISRRTGVSLLAIIAANPQIVDPDRIFVGQIINVPLRS